MSFSNRIYSNSRLGVVATNVETELGAGAGGSIMSASNVGIGAGTLFKQETSGDLEFKSLLTGVASGLTITNNADEVLIGADEGNLIVTNMQSGVLDGVLKSVTDQVVTGANLTDLADVTAVDLTDTPLVVYNGSSYDVKPITIGQIKDVNVGAMSDGEVLQFDGGTFRLVNRDLDTAGIVDKTTAQSGIGGIKKFTDKMVVNDKGIATGYALSVQGSTPNNWIEILNGASLTDQGAFFGLETGSNFTLNNYQGGDITFYAAPTPTTTIERMRIKNDGKISIADLTASQIVETDASKNLISAPKGTAYNKNFGLLAGNVLDGATDISRANAVITSGVDVAIVATPPTAGQVLEATSATSCQWTTPAGGIPTQLASLSNNITINTNDALVGQTLVATSATNATWQTPAGGVPTQTDNLQDQDTLTYDPVNAEFRNVAGNTPAYSDLRDIGAINSNDSPFPIVNTFTDQKHFVASYAHVHNGNPNTFNVELITISGTPPTDPVASLFDNNSLSTKFTIPVGALCRINLDILTPEFISNYMEVSSNNPSFFQLWAYDSSTIGQTGDNFGSEGLGGVLIQENVLVNVSNPQSPQPPYAGKHTRYFSFRCPAAPNVGSLYLYRPYPTQSDQDPFGGAGSHLQVVMSADGTYHTLSDYTFDFNEHAFVNYERLNDYAVQTRVLPSVFNDKYFMDNGSGATYHIKSTAGAKLELAHTSGTLWDANILVAESYVPINQYPKIVESSLLAVSTTPVTLVKDNLHIHVSLATASVVNLIAPQTADRYIIRDVSGARTGSAISITTNGAELIDGIAGPLDITSDYGCVELYSDGTNWWSLTKRL